MKGYNEGSLNVVTILSIGEPRQYLVLVSATTIFIHHDSTDGFYYLVNYQPYTSLTQPAPVNIVADTALTLMYPIVQIPVNNLTKKVYLSSLSIGSTEDNSQLFCLLHNGYLGVLVH